MSSFGPGLFTSTSAQVSANLSSKTEFINPVQYTISGSLNLVNFGYFCKSNTLFSTTKIAIIVGVTDSLSSHHCKQQFIMRNYNLLLGRKIHSL